MNMTVPDLVLIGALSMLAAVLFYLIPGWVLSHGTSVEIRVGEEVAGRYPLDEERTLEVKGPLGISLVKIENGRAGIVSSPCPNKLCIQMGDVGKEGGVAVCVPNKVILTVGGHRDLDLDAVSK